MPGENLCGWPFRWEPKPALSSLHVAANKDELADAIAVKLISSINIVNLILIEYVPNSAWVLSFQSCF